MRAARSTPATGWDAAALAAHVRDVVGLLADHADHEDAHIQPVLERHLPELAGTIGTDHARLEERTGSLVEVAGLVEAARPADQRALVHHLYRELASFTGDYLRHQDVEERVVMPTLESAVGVEAVLAIHQAIVGSIPPEQMAASLAVMLPAMNLEDRTDLLGGMQAGCTARGLRRGVGAGGLRAGPGRPPGARSPPGPGLRAPGVRPGPGRGTGAPGTRRYGGHRTDRGCRRR